MAFKSKSPFNLKKRPESLYDLASDKREVDLYEKKWPASVTKEDMFAQLFNWLKQSGTYDFLSGKKPAKNGTWGHHRSPLFWAMMTTNTLLSSVLNPLTDSERKYLRSLRVMGNGSFDFTQEI